MPDIGSVSLDLSNSNIALRGNTWNVFKVGSTYYAKKNDNTNVSSNSDFSTLFQSIIDSISSFGSEQTTIKIAPGTYSINTTISITNKYNVSVIGSGPAMTVLEAGPSLSGASAVLDIQSTITATSRALTANATLKAFTVTVSTSDSATFAEGDRVLLRSNALFSALSSKKGEIKQIDSIDTGTGIITFTTPLLDSYATADSASIITIPFSQHIYFSDLTLGVNATYAGTGRIFHNRFVDDFLLNNVILEDPPNSFDSGIVYRSCIHGRISNCHLIMHESVPTNEQYGIAIEDCSQNIVITNCTSRGRFRHPFEAGNNKNSSNGEGVCRGIIFEGCAGSDCHEAVFDTHADGDGIQFSNCRVLGKRLSYGIQSRTIRTKINNCHVQTVELDGINLDENAFESEISDTIIVDSKRDGIRLGGGIDDIRISNCLIKNSTGEGIQVVTGPSDRVAITNCMIIGNGSDGIDVTDGDNWLIANNLIKDNGGWGIDFSSGNCQNEIIDSNNFTNNTSGAINNGNQTGNIESDNFGYGSELDAVTGQTSTNVFTYPDVTGRVLVIDRNFFEMADEFSCGSITNTNTSNQIGTLNWGFSTSGTSAPVVTAGVTTHPGIATLVTGATSTNNSRLHLTDAAATAFIDPTDIDRFAWIIRIPTITTMSVRIGVGQDISSTTFGTAGAWFSFDSAVNAAWQTITRQASTSTTNTTSVTVTANNWYMLEAIRLSGGNWEFYVNNSLVFTHSANQPTTACNVGAMVQTGTTAARNLDIDWFKFRTKKLAQRWT